MEGVAWQPGEWFTLMPLRFELEAIDPVVLPSYEGSMLRGALGHALRAVSCVMDRRECVGCMLCRSCVHARVFETLPAHRSLYRGADVPHPWVLVLDPQAPRHIAPGEHLRFGMVLLGSERDVLPYLVLALDRAARRGLGRRRARARLDSVWQQVEDGRWARIFDTEERRLRPFSPVRPTLPECPDHVRVVLHTPCRLRRRGRLVSEKEFTAGDLLWSLRQRMSVLQSAYAGSDVATVPEDAIGDDALHLDFVPERLAWREWTRYSSRQQTQMRMGGVVGSFLLSGPMLPDVWPLLWYGQWIHAGKIPSMGLGRYEVKPFASLRTSNSRVI